jgi:hypothetical protein
LVLGYKDDLDHGIAVRSVLETVNGMAKMKPMTEHQMRRAGWQRAPAAGEPLLGEQKTGGVAGSVYS